MDYKLFSKPPKTIAQLRAERPCDAIVLGYILDEYAKLAYDVGTESRTIPPDLSLERFRHAVEGLMDEGVLRILWAPQAPNGGGFFLLVWDEVEHEYQFAFTGGKKPDWIERSELQEPGEGWKHGKPDEWRPT